MIVLLLSVLTCEGGHLTVDQCPPEQLAVYDMRTWIGPTEQNMLDCLSSKRTLEGNGERAKCEIVSGNKADYPDGALNPSAFDYKPRFQSWTF